MLPLIEWMFLASSLQIGFFKNGGQAATERTACVRWATAMLEKVHYRGPDLVFSFVSKFLGRCIGVSEANVDGCAKIISRSFAQGIRRLGKIVTDQS